MKKKRKRRPHQKKKPSKSRAITAKPQPSQMVVYRNQRPVVLTDRQIDLIKRLYAKDANEDEFELFMQICKSSRLDPFKKEIYCLIFSKDNPQKRQMVIITGIDGYRSTAARDHKDFGGADAAVFTWFDPPQKTPAGKLIPESATVTVKDTKGGRTTATVWWEELVPRDLKEPKADFWNRMPKNQLEKCGEAKAIRKRFPGRGNMFIREEMDQAMQDLTPEGRQISTDGIAPSGAIVDQHAAAKAAQQRVLDDKLAHGHPPGSERAKQAEAALQRAEDEDERLAGAKNVTPKPEEKPKPRSPMNGMTLVNGTLSRVVESKASNGAAMVDAQIGNTHYKCFHSKSLFKYLLQYGRMGGFNIQAYIGKTGTIEGLKKIGPVMFEDDGKTEKVFTREPGQEG